MTKLMEFFGFSGREWVGRVQKDIEQDAALKIKITDAVVDERNVIALVVDDVIVDYVGMSNNDFDPDGRLLEGSPTRLIKKMLKLRNGYINQQMQIKGVFQEMMRVGIPMPSSVMDSQITSARRIAFGEEANND